MGGIRLRPVVLEGRKKDWANGKREAGVPRLKNGT